MIWDVHPGSQFRIFSIPDPWSRGKKAPDPRSATQCVYSTYGTAQYAPVASERWAPACWGQSPNIEYELSTPGSPENKSPNSSVGGYRFLPLSNCTCSIAYIFEANMPQVWLMPVVQLGASPRICKKVRMTLILFSGAWRKMSHEKTWCKKILWHCPFKDILG